jgi:hypothetical protein
VGIIASTNDMQVNISYVFESLPDVESTPVASSTTSQTPAATSKISEATRMHGGWFELSMLLALCMIVLAFI